MDERQAGPVPGVATEPQAPPDGADQEVGEGLLQDALPQITEVARKVGGFQRLAEIAAQLDRAGVGR